MEDASEQSLEGISLSTSQEFTSSESKDQSPFIRFLQKIWALFLLFLGRKPKK